MSAFCARRIALLSATATTFVTSMAFAGAFTKGSLLVTRSDYTGTASTVTVGQALPGGGNAVADGTFPGVFDNASVDASFGVTSPIHIDQYSVSGGGAALLNTLDVPTNLAVTSFPSKSELGMQLSTDGKHVSFMAYVAGVNALDVSNSNTPNHVDPTNPVTITPVQRAIVTVDVNGNVQATPVNAYSGNNGRGAILDSVNNQYFLAGNAGNGASPEPVGVVNNTGVQLLPFGSSGETTVVGVQQGVVGAANGFQYGYSVTQYGFAADKSGKDDNFRGITIFNNTLYVTKGSGGNGIDTVFQVGTAGTLPTAGTASATTITVLPGFPTSLAKNTTAPLPLHPFGIWFANSTTLYVADEGDGTATSPDAGLQKWTLSSGTWSRAYTVQAGLNLGTPYGVPGLATALNPSPAGLRQLTGKLNGNGTVTLYATTSTVSTLGDQGGDSNQLLSVVDTLAATAPTAGETFTLLQTAPLAQVFRGVSFAPSVASPVPMPRGATGVLGFLLLGLGLGGIGLRMRKSHRLASN